MAEYFGPFWPEGYFGSGYWGEAASGGPVYLDAGVVLSGAGGFALADATAAQDAQQPARPAGSGSRRRASWRRASAPPEPVYLDTGAVLSAGGALAARAGSIVTAGAVLTASASVVAAPESAPTYTADAAFWLMAA